MKLMIASDIHGSFYYCEKLMERFDKENPDKLLLLGDLLYHGPRNDLPRDYAPKKVIELLNFKSEYILCVRGNCESEVDQMVLDFPCLADYAFLSVDGIDIFATHGHHFGENNPPKFSKFFALICGHTHISKCVDNDGYVYMNPGSVSIPKENTPAGYMIIENGSAVWKTLDGEIYNEYRFGEN